LAKVQDVAAYILQRRGPMTAMKLQKLVYYAQAWHLVWDEKPLFSSRIEAWANGPVCRDLYRLHRGHFTIGLDDLTPAGAQPDAIDEAERATIDVVIDAYADKSAHWLSELTHREPPCGCSAPTRPSASAASSYSGTVSAAPSRRGWRPPCHPSPAW
jgi:uncharacterized phage-associated protein